MPRGDKTGPLGQGPMTGRKAGLCAGNDKPGYADQNTGAGFGRGVAGGRGRKFRNVTSERGMRGNMFFGGQRLNQKNRVTGELIKEEEPEMLSDEEAILKND